MVGNGRVAVSGGCRRRGDVSRRRGPGVPSGRGESNTATVRTANTAARLGGDEFAVLLDGDADRPV